MSCLLEATVRDSSWRHCRDVVLLLGIILSFRFFFIPDIVEQTSDEPQQDVHICILHAIFLGINSSFFSGLLVEYLLKSISVPLLLEKLWLLIPELTGQIIVLLGHIFQLEQFYTLLLCFFSLRSICMMYSIVRVLEKSQMNVYTTRKCAAIFILYTCAISTSASGVFSTWVPFLFAVPCLLYWTYAIFQHKMKLGVRIKFLGTGNEYWSEQLSLWTSIIGYVSILVLAPPHCFNKSNPIPHSYELCT